MPQLTLQYSQLPKRWLKRYQRSNSMGFRRWKLSVPNRNFITMEIGQGNLITEYLKRKLRVSKTHQGRQQQDQGRIRHQSKQVCSNSIKPTNVSKFSNKYKDVRIRFLVVILQPKSFRKRNKKERSNKYTCSQSFFPGLEILKMWMNFRIRLKTPSSNASKRKGWNWIINWKNMMNIKLNYWKPRSYLSSIKKDIRSWIRLRSCRIWTKMANEFLKHPKWSIKWRQFWVRIRTCCRIERMNKNRPGETISKYNLMKFSQCQRRKCFLGFHRINQIRQSDN